jgi:hypothetical protein
MVQKITVALEDDLDGGPADETVRFGLSGADYEIDLSGGNAAAFRAQFELFIKHARKDGRGRPRRLGPATGRQQRASRIRDWARDHGIEINERGRIPARVAEQYYEVTEGR